MSIELLDGFKLGSYEVEPALGVVDRPEGAKSLRPEAMEILVVLAERPRTPVSKSDLIAKIWGSSGEGAESFDQCIDELRDALDRPGRRQNYLQYVPGRGYKLSASVRPLFQDSPTRGVRRFWYEL